VSYPGSETVDTTHEQLNSADNPSIGNNSVSYGDDKIRRTQGGDEMNLLSDENKKRESSREKGTEFSIKPPTVELWKGLYQRHWPELLNNYNISLLGR